MGARHDNEELFQSRKVSKLFAGGVMRSANLGQTLTQAKLAQGSRRICCRLSRSLGVSHARDGAKCYVGDRHVVRLPDVRRDVAPAHDRSFGSETREGESRAVSTSS